MYILTSPVLTHFSNRRLNKIHEENVMNNQVLELKLFATVLIVRGRNLGRRR